MTDHPKSPNKQAGEVHREEIARRAKYDAREIVWAEDLGKCVSDEMEARLIDRIAAALTTATDEAWERAIAVARNYEGGLFGGPYGAARRKIQNEIVGALEAAQKE